MTPATPAFPLPEKLETILQEVHDYWAGLKRGNADMPFADDVDPSSLRKFAEKLMLVAAFQNDERFRFEFVGEEVAGPYGGQVKGEFSDDVEQRSPLDSFTVQCSATVGTRVPTYFSHRPPGETKGYARILLPTWGDGRVSMLLGAVVPLNRDQ